jgi:hypothetical protein
MDMKTKLAVYALAVTLAAIDSAHAQSDNTVTVTADNFLRAESHMYFANVVKQVGTGKFLYGRQPMPIDHQTVIRANRDTLYSSAAFDLDAGPVTVTLPDAGKRFMSMQAIDEDEYVPEVVYGAGSHAYSKEKIGTRYVMLGIRMLVDPNDRNDVEQVHRLQDAIQVDQAGGPGRFEAPDWDTASQKKVRDALLVLAGTLPDTKRMFGRRGEVDPVRHLIGAATGWGGNPERDAMYLTVVPGKNDGAIIHRLSVKDVPVDGFWSITVYNSEGYIQKNEYDAYSVNDITANKSADGSVAVQFGGCNGTIPNCLPIMAGWNYWVRLYRPRAEILNGTWKFPEAQSTR